MKRRHPDRPSHCLARAQDCADAARLLDLLARVEHERLCGHEGEALLLLEAVDIDGALMLARTFEGLSLNGDVMTLWPDNRGHSVRVA